MKFNSISLLWVASIGSASAFAPSNLFSNSVHGVNTPNRAQTNLSSDSGDWNGEIDSNASDGRIRGCQVTRVEGSITEYEIRIDGVEADLGKFSEAIYRKISSDVKQQRFQGFRPGTIPPHLLPTYIGFAMDECAREATLEAMQQNNIRPFDGARDDIEFESISILPKKSKKKKKKKRKKNTEASNEEAVAPEEAGPQWKSYGSMKEAISAGWKPGQSFSFVAKNLKGQQLQDQDVTGASPIGGGTSLM